MISHGNMEDTHTCYVEPLTEARAASAVSPIAVRNSDCHPKEGWVSVSVKNFSKSS